ncbi:MAG: hypothetical protein ACC645_24795 [Pirellulales bacterium]
MLTTLWWGQMDASKPVLALIGGDGPLEIGMDRLATRRQTARSADETVRTPDRLYNHYLGDWLPRHPFRVNTDEHPRVEFLTPISNRDHKMLEGIALLDYYNTVPSQLPSCAAHLRSADGTRPALAAQRLAWQRFILFGQ